jgi:hypothetical protein
VSNASVTDDIINEGFRSLAQVMAAGFDGLRREMNEGFAQMEQRFAQVDQRFAQMEPRFGSLEHRMMRRFDEVGGRFDGHERRITALESQP